MIILLGLLLLIGIIIVIFTNQPSFGRLPRGERLLRIEKSLNYQNGQFVNLQPTALMTSGKGRIRTMLDFLLKKPVEDLRPNHPVPAVKIDLQTLDRNKEILIWFGHSSYLIQTGGKRFLVDPVFIQASPVSFINKPFDGTDIYKPEDMPDIDYLIISHDHWDHLDYHTVMQLKDRIGKVICPLGVGEHFEYWSFAPEKLVELDWKEQASLENGFRIYCLPARHFSGRGLISNHTLWTSFLLQSPNKKIYIGGDSGYGDHFAEIGQQFPDIDLAILENGQYNKDWQYIHTIPEYLPQEIKDLRAKNILTVHHSKYALARHPWNEPLKNAQRLEEDSLNVWIPQIGEIVSLNNDNPTP